MIAPFVSVLLAPTAYGWTGAPKGPDLGAAGGDFAPETRIRAGRVGGNGWEAGFGFSLDGGANWRPPFALPPGAETGVRNDGKEGRVAVSSDGTTWVWALPSGTYRTDDYGMAWTPSAGLPAGLSVVADRTSPNRFYALDLAGGRLYASEDGAKRFAPRDLGLAASVTGPAGDGLYPTPGRAGDFWIAGRDGLFHAAPTRRFARLPGVEAVRALGFGVAAPASPLPSVAAKTLRALGLGEVARTERPPALYLAGTIEGESGLFRSDDAGGRWTRLEGEAPSPGGALRIAGDAKKYGRVYVATREGGVVCGDPR